MFNIFRQAIDSQISASPAYLEHLQRVFRDDRSSGMIHVQIGVDCQLVLFFYLGLPVGAYRLEADRCLPIQLAQAGSDWQVQEGPVRMLELPPQALRLAVQAAEWYAPRPIEDLPEEALVSFLETYRLNQETGLLQISTLSEDGFLLLWQGVPVSADAVFCGKPGHALFSLSAASPGIGALAESFVGALSEFGGTEPDAQPDQGYEFTGAPQAVEYPDGGNRAA
jgi:hypothetical protein